MPVNKYQMGCKYFNYFQLTHQFEKGNHLSSKLMEFISYYLNRISFREVEKLLTRIIGNKIISNRHISNIVNDLAIEISENQQEEVNNVLTNADLSFPKIDTTFDIYDKNVEEVIVSEDGIQVNSQKPHHDKKPLPKASPKINTNVFFFSKPDKSFQYLITGIDRFGNDIVAFEDLIKSSIISVYQYSKKALNIVAITDGACNIRKHLKNIFNVNVVHILDWYHLEKKLSEYLSMLHFSKSDKRTHFSYITNQLWFGNTKNAISYLKELNTDNPEKLSELIGYLEKHSSEIINYDKRQKVNKPIGSGRIEKTVDTVIGHRQKKKGMSWRKLGSKSLGLLKIAELNNSWDNLWEKQIA